MKNLSKDHTSYLSSHMLVIIGIFLLIFGSGVILLALISQSFIAWATGSLLTVAGVFLYRSAKNITFDKKKD